MGLAENYLNEWLIFMVFMEVNIPYMDSMGFVILVVSKKGDQDVQKV